MNGWTPQAIGAVITAAAGLVAAVTALLRQLRHERAPGRAAHRPAPPASVSGPQGAAGKAAGPSPPAGTQ